MATVFTRVVFARQHTASSHCPAVTRAHISTGRPAVLYWKSLLCNLCYAACCSVGLPVQLSPLFLTSLLACAQLVLGHLQASSSGVVKKKALIVYWKTCSGLLKRIFYESSLCEKHWNRIDVDRKVCADNKNLCKQSVKIKRREASKAAACIWWNCNRLLTSFWYK